MGYQPVIGGIGLYPSPSGAAVYRPLVYGTGFYKKRASSSMLRPVIGGAGFYSAPSAGTSPQFTSSPVITSSGNLAEPVNGDILSCDGGVASGSPTPTKEYQWQRNGTSTWVDAIGETNPTYTVSDADGANATPAIVTLGVNENIDNSGTMTVEVNFQVFTVVAASGGGGDINCGLVGGESAEEVLTALIFAMSSNTSFGLLASASAQTTTTLKVQTVQANAAQIILIGSRVGCFDGGYSGDSQGTKAIPASQLRCNVTASNGINPPAIASSNESGYKIP